MPLAIESRSDHVRSLHAGRYGNTKEKYDIVSDKKFDVEAENNRYGFEIAVNDVDGDEINDIIIGADYWRQKTGRVYIHCGNESSGPSTKPGRIFTGESPEDLFSIGLACGDVNNDGYSDLVIGARGYKAGSEQGRVYLYYGASRWKKIVA